MALGWQITSFLLRLAACAGPEHLAGRQVALPALLGGGGSGGSGGGSGARQLQGAGEVAGDVARTAQLQAAIGSERSATEVTRRDK